jgi:hypothetical protein
LKLSATPFCRGFPGSINAVLIPCASIYDNSAFETNSGRLSLGKKAGVPRWLTSRLRTSITLPEPIRPPTSIVRHLSCWLLAQRSNSKLQNHTWVGPAAFAAAAEPQRHVSLAAYAEFDET